MKEISVIGGGSMATALVKILTENKVQVNWYVKRLNQADHIREKDINPDYLSFVKLQGDFIYISTDLNEIIKRSPIIVFLIPSSQLTHLSLQIEVESLKNKFIITSIKGLVGTDKVLPSVFMSNYFAIPEIDIGIIAGPCHAEEIAHNRRTYMTLCSKNLHMMEQLAPYFSTSYVSVGTSEDLLGIEYAAIYKNVVGIIIGIAKGLNYGDNFIAVLMSNAINELQLFLKTIGIHTENLASSSYLGDMLVTGYSHHSRNRTFGELIGKGLSVEQAMRKMSMVVEGYTATQGLYQLSKSIKLMIPLLYTSYRILFLHMPVDTEFKLLEKNIR
ncbi:MAG TPA: glycerol-3-phosphate dehydrogenase [Sphingobacterium sp.]|nr:glycerol-3-phosphate dehydrogenase [Sphingobacterium sp.]